MTWPDSFESLLWVMTGHKDIRMVVKYDHERGNLEENAINFLNYDDKK